MLTPSMSHDDAKLKSCQNVGALVVRCKNSSDRIPNYTAFMPTRPSMPCHPCHPCRAMPCHAMSSMPSMPGHATYDDHACTGRSSSRPMMTSV